MQRFIIWIGLFAYLTLLVLAIVFYRERTIFLDASFQLFEILRTGDFAIQANRFGAALTQIFPLLGARLNLSLPWVLITYSTGFIFYYFIIFFFCLKIFKNWQLALAVLLFNTLMVSYTFWWMQIEFAQGIALTILLIAFLSRQKPWEYYNAFEITMLFLLVLTLVYFHPLLPVVLVFTLLFALLKEERKYDQKPFQVSLLLVGILFLFKNFVLPSASYDASAMSGLKNLITLFPNYVDIPSNKDFLKYLIKDYYLLPIVLFMVSVFYVRQRQWLKMGLVWSFFLGYLLLINVSNYQGMPQFHIESFYLPLSIFVIFPLVYDVLPAAKNQHVWTAALMVVVIIRLTHIGLLHRPYTQRLSWQSQLLEKTEGKLLLREDQVPMDTLLMSWGSSYEFWLLSALKNPANPRSILIDEDPARLDWAIPNNKGFLTEWGMFNYDELPKQYFNFQDTSYYQHYRLK